MMMLITLHHFDLFERSKSLEFPFVSSRIIAIHDKRVEKNFAMMKPTKETTRDVPKLS